MTLMASDESLLRHEVVELTDMLRDEEGFSEVRRFLREKSLDPSTVTLAGFIEDSDGFEGGVIVTPQRSVYRYTRNAYSMSCRVGTRLVIQPAFSRPIPPSRWR